MIAAFGWGALAASSLILGGLIAGRWAISNRLLGLVMAFGAGVLISAVAYDIVLDAYESGAAGTSVGAGLAAGALCFYAGDTWLDKIGFEEYVGERKGILRGDWGTSWKYQRNKPVLDLIKDRLPATLWLMVTSTLVSLLIGIPLGIFSAVRQYSFFDYFFTAFSFIGISIPAFWFGLLIISVSLIAKSKGWFYFPAGDILADAGGVFDRRVGPARRINRFIEFTEHSLSLQLAHDIQRHQTVWVLIGILSIISGVDGVELLWIQSIDALNIDCCEACGPAGLHLLRIPFGHEPAVSHQGDGRGA